VQLARNFEGSTILVMGIVGYGLNRYGFSPGPVGLGLVLGGPLEERLIQSLTAASGSPLGLIDRPMTLGVAVVAGIIAISIVRTSIREFKQNSA